MNGCPSLRHPGWSTTLLSSVGSFILLLHGEQGHQLTAALKRLYPYLPGGTQVDPDGEYAFCYWYYGTRVNYLRGGYPWQAWLARKVRQVCEGGLGSRAMYLATVDSATEWLSRSSSDRIRGAPHVGFPRDMRRIRSRISRSTCDLPGFLGDFHRQ